MTGLAAGSSRVRGAPPRDAWAPAFDAAVIVLFAAIGRRNHDESTALGGVVRTAAPFLLAAVMAWLLLAAWSQRRRRHVDGRRFAAGVVVWVVTVVLGMLARRVIFDRGTAATFVVVATLFLGAGLLGWRAVAREIRARRRASIGASGRCDS